MDEYEFHLTDKGRRELPAVMEAMASGATFDQAVEQVTGEPLDLRNEPEIDQLRRRIRHCERAYNRVFDKWQASRFVLEQIKDRAGAEGCAEFCQHVDLACEVWRIAARALVEEAGY
jgi:hypothetical protein